MEGDKRRMKRLNKDHKKADRSPYARPVIGRKKNKRKESGMSKSSETLVTIVNAGSDNTLCIVWYFIQLINCRLGRVQNIQPLGIYCLCQCKYEKEVLCVCLVQINCYGLRCFAWAKFIFGSYVWWFFCCAGSSDKRQCIWPSQYKVKSHSVPANDGSF